MASFEKVKRSELQADVLLPLIPSFGQLAKAAKAETLVFQSIRSRQTLFDVISVFALP